MATILVIDDERPIRSALREILEFEKFKVDDAEDGLAGLSMIEKNKYDVILCDIKMPKMDGTEVLGKIISMGIDVPVVMISGHGTVETAVDAIKGGAFDFIQKPLDLNRILVTIRNAMDRADLVQETKVLKRKVHKALTNEIIGESAPIQQIKEMIDKVAPSDARVMITGANGSGKRTCCQTIA